MSRTAVDHGDVRVYLYRLDIAMRGLPAVQYRELRDQIIAHLDDALPPEADDQQVAAALSQLGSPADLAAEARADFGPTIRAVLAASARRKWALIAGARTRTKVLAAVIVLGLVTGGTYLGVLLSAPLIEFGDSSVPWYTRDASRQVFATADGAQQVTFPIRSGQRQGFLFGIYNPSNFTETVRGPVTIYGTNAIFGGGGFDKVEMGVSVPNRVVAGGGTTRDVAFTLPASIPPHQYRLLRITWLSTMCLEGKGSGFLIDNLYIRVRVGWFTRTDVIHLGFGWGLSGPSTHPDTQPGPNYNKCL
ncbi:MAG TPA: hypothetical protein VLM11_13760 [Streptosporangiaceae bacterium]|nr:hypothetical protein [Streptosporangiaceae bacterium]